MTQSASQAAAFYRDVAKNRMMWTVEDDVGYPAPMTSSGQRAQPFWSSKKRAEKIIAEVPAYAIFKPVEVTWDDFVNNWASDLASSGLLMGINWSGPRATGYDVEPANVLQNVEHYIHRGPEADDQSMA